MTQKVTKELNEYFHNRDGDGLTHRKSFNDLERHEGKGVGILDLLLPWMEGPPLFIRKLLNCEPGTSLLRNNFYTTPLCSSS